MIHLNRLLIRQLRSVLYRGLSLSPRTSSHPVYVTAGRDGLSVRGQTADTVIEFHLPGDHGGGQVALPLAAWKRCEGTRPDPVTFECPDPETLVARWLDRGIPQVEGIAVREWDESPAARPDRVEPNPPLLLTALRDAAETIEPNASRLSLNCLHLRGSLGQIETTDSRQLLVQSGFRFPWTEDVLVPAGKFFGSRDLPVDQPVVVGRAGDWISFEIGPWTVRLCIPKEGRFPRIDDVVPQAGTVVGRLHVHESDAQFLAESIGRLPGAEERNSPITVDLNGSLAIRARAGDEDPQATELILSNSSRTGEPLRFNMDRRYLQHALRLGFREFWLQGAEVAACGRDEHRTYVWMLLTPEGAILPDFPKTRIESPLASDPSATDPIPPRTSMTRKHTPPPVTPDVEPASAPETALPQSPIAQIETLHGILRDALQQSRELLTCLKRQKKQSRLVESTLASLRELQTTGI